MEIDASQIDRLRAAVANLSVKLGDVSSLTAALGPVLQAQTQHRIDAEKAAPDGTPWREWSASYAKTRNASHSLLIDTRAMVNTIQWHASGDEIEVGSARPYAGAVNAERQFVGLSPANERELEVLALKILEGYLREVAA